MFPQHPPEFWKKSSSLMQCWEFMNKIKDQYINANNAEACIQSVFYENHLPKNIDNPQFCVYYTESSCGCKFYENFKVMEASLQCQCSDPLVTTIACDIRQPKNQ